MDEDGKKKTGKQHNVLPLWGNEATMNLNPLILANIQSSSYFKVKLFKLKTYHEVVDEIYYQVKHLEPWERGSRKTAGQTGMCGGVRGVGAGGIVSTAYCLLFKLYTLRLTRKQVNGLLTHTDSPYIRSLGYMYIRYTQPPGDLFDWYEEYLQDEEEVDAKAGGGQSMTIGQMLHQFLVKLDWFSTLFPRIPVPMQKQIESKLANYSRQHNVNLQARFQNTEREMNAANNANKRDMGGGGGGREYFDRNRSAATATVGSNGYGTGGGGSGAAAGRYDRGDDRRYRSRSRDRPASGANDGSSRDRDRYRDRSSSDHYNSSSYSKERSGYDRKFKDSSYYSRGDGDGGGGGGGSGSTSTSYDSNRHRDRNYR